MTKAETAEMVERARAEAREEGVQAERARIIRCRNACFTKVRANDEMRTALSIFDGLLLRGEDPR